MTAPGDEVLAFSTKRVRASGGVELAVDTWPVAGPAVRPGFLLVHGLASNARMWDGVAAELASRGRPVAAVDLRGHGRSAKPDLGYDYPTLCDDLRLVISSLVEADGAFERPVAVGQSFGANLVLELAAGHRELLSGVGCVDGGTIGLRRRFADFEAAWEAMAPPRTTGTPYEELARRLRSMHPDWPDSGIAGSLANFERRQDGTVAPWLTRERHGLIIRTLYEADPSAVYPQVTVPVLMMPALAPDRAAEKLAAIEEAMSALPVARLHPFSPADHDVHAQHPRQVAAALLEVFRWG